jgi:microcystin-dependent protein
MIKYIYIILLLLYFYVEKTIYKELIIYISFCLYFVYNLYHKSKVKYEKIIMIILLLGYIYYNHKKNDKEVIENFYYKGGPSCDGGHPGGAGTTWTINQAAQDAVSNFSPATKASFVTTTRVCNNVPRQVSTPATCAQYGYIRAGRGSRHACIRWTTASTRTVIDNICNDVPIAQDTSTYTLTAPLTNPVTVASDPTKISTNDAIKNINIAANEIAINNMFNAASNINFMGTVKSNNSELVPPGFIIAYAGDKLPNGWVWCNGDNNTPDLRGRTIIGSGQGENVTFRNVRDKDGKEEHILTINEMPSHSHTLSSDGKHSHQYNITSFLHQIEVGGGSGTDDLHDVHSNPETTENTHTHNVQNTGSDWPHNNMQPYLAMNYIMRK